MGYTISHLICCICLFKRQSIRTMPTFEIPPLSAHIGRTYLDQLIEARKTGLHKLQIDLPPNDHTVALRLRNTFNSEVVTPILSPYAQLSTHSENDPNYHGTTGYLIGIDVFLDMYQAFRNCEAVQVCFGMDKPLDEGGQLQLIFRGHSNPAPSPSDVVFVTPQPLEDYPFPHPPINPPRICPTATSC